MAAPKTLTAEQADSLAAWLALETEPRPGAQTSVHNLFTRYRAWTIARNLPTATYYLFLRAVTERAQITARELPDVHVAGIALTTPLYVPDGAPL